MTRPEFCESICQDIATHLSNTFRKNYYIHHFHAGGWKGADFQLLGPTTPTGKSTAYTITFRMFMDDTIEPRFVICLLLGHKEPHYKVFQHRGTDTKEVLLSLNEIMYYMEEHG